jgi:hypothetical protein
MVRVESNSDFIGILSKLPLAQQHHLAKKFISGVIHLTDDPRLARLLDLLKKPECSPDDLKMAHSIAQSVYVESGPTSGFAEIDFNSQATHFIAQAVLACSKPDDTGAYTAHLAHKVANFCRMAQLCSSMGHVGESPDFPQAEAAYKKIVNAQYDIVNQFMEAQGA